MKRIEVDASRLEMLASPWPIHEAELEGAVDRVLAMMDWWQALGPDAREAREARGSDRERRSLVSDVGSTRVVKLHGIMVSFDVPQWVCDWWGIAVTARVMKYVVEADEDPTVQRIVLDVDSPGGMIGGVAEFGTVVAECETPLDAHVSDMGASAAYWVASGARQLTCTTTSMVGSVGVRMTAYRFKPDRVSWERLDFTSSQTPRKAMDLWHPDEDKRRQAREDVQKILDDSADVFLEHVTEQRGDHEGNLDGRVFVGTEAVASGYADVLSTMGAVLAPPREEDQMSRKGTETTGDQGTETTGDQERIDAIAALKIPDALKWEAVQKGLTPLEAMQLAYDRKGATPEGGELGDRKAHEKETDTPPAAALPAGGNEEEATEFLAAFRDAGKRMGPPGARQSTLRPTATPTGG